MKNNIERDDLDALISYLKLEDPILTHGPKVLEFENKWSEWLGVKHSTMVNSGSSANDLTMLALREMYGEGEVIVPALTWVSDIASVLHAQLTPKFVDINLTTLGLDTKKVLDAVSAKTKAVFLTHVLGYNALTDELINELDRANILLIEDVCESHGALHRNKKLGTFGWASNFSFYYAHHLTTIEGGMVCTDDPELFDIVRMLRSHGLVRESLNSDKKNQFTRDFPELNKEFIFAYHSHNMRPTELNGILGLSQLKRLDSNNYKRAKNLELFLNNLDPEVFQTNFNIEGNSNYALTLVLKNGSFERRDRVEKLLTNEKVEFRRGLSGGGNQLRQPYLRSSQWAQEPESLPNTDFVHHFGWYIGNYPSLNSDEIIWLCELLSQIK
jgi:CDP-6-deoxy-D-xylo-4-hexulose-3-dehydrase